MVDTSVRVLVVSNLVTMARVMKTFATRIGYTNIDVCHDGEIAIRMLKQKKYGLVLCDFETERMNGALWACRVRGEPGGRDCIIVLTTTSRERACEAEQNGLLLIADGLIVKPFGSLELKAALDEIYERRPT